MLLVFLVGEENASRGFLLFFRLQRYEFFYQCKSFLSQFLFKIRRADTKSPILANKKKWENLLLSTTCCNRGGQPPLFCLVLRLRKFSFSSLASAFRPRITQIAQIGYTEGSSLHAWAITQIFQNSTDKAQ